MNQDLIHTPSLEGRDLINQLLGQAQMASAFADFSRTIGVTKLRVVKENKLYQQLRGIQNPNAIGELLKGTWEEFCNLLGMSVDKADEDIKNLQAFGEAALERMQSIGIGYRDLKQFRRLPEDSQVALVEAAKAGDKETLLELAEDLIAKQRVEKERLQNQVSEWKAAAANKEADFKAAEAEAAGLRKQLASTQHQPAGDAMPLFIKDMRAEIAALLKKAELSVESLVPIESELGGLRHTAVDDWVQPSGQLLMAGLVALRMQTDGAIARLAEKLEIGAPNLLEPDVLAGLSKFEVAEIAGVYHGLLRTHEHEAALRQYERDQERPKGKGRPKAAPKAPE